MATCSNSGWRNTRSHRCRRWKKGPSTRKCSGRHPTSCDNTPPAACCLDHDPKTTRVRNHSMHNSHRNAQHLTGFQVFPRSSWIKTGSEKRTWQPCRVAMENIFAYNSLFFYVCKHSRARGAGFRSDRPARRESTTSIWSVSLTSPATSCAVHHSPLT